MVVGYAPNVLSASYPTVLIYGIYPTLNEARQRQFQLSGLSAMPSDCVVRGRYITWLKDIEMGDTRCDILTKFMDIASQTSSTTNY